MFLAYGCSSSKTASSSKRYKKNKRRVVTKKRSVRTKDLSQLANRIIATANTYKGTRYKYGGVTRKGMDCSGLIMTSFKQNGLSLPRTSYDMSTQGKQIPLKNVRKGDLLFFTTNPRKPRRISHVGLVTSVKNGIIYFIHASSKRGVTVNNMSQKYYKRNFAKAKRVLR
ncbi:C40 family peptidase [Tenacibaculum jejuense]|uniref:Putative lipoprotein NlpC n=1 Tax=Tenacibaculum jejuense TaxID=584609 RepID=A0A238U8N0_9FLAO|nr:C40 family peptidase [Tenacibaculum jejuense]SNR14844.1 putative lipoprotein NlpC [Tenacibaculum jejuense]